MIEPWQWVFAVLAALFIGLAKTAVPGLGMVSVALFANLLPAREASGFVLPLLLCGDFVAVAAYRSHTQWLHLARLAPWIIGGVVLGWWAMARIDDREASLLIGAIILGMVGLHLWRRWRGGEAAGQGMAFAALIGVLAGFTTLVANAAGPLMAIYLLAMRLPKLEFVGTAAVFFLLVNAFKVPFMIDLGLIDGRSALENALLAPIVIAGAAVGRRILPHIDQKRFEQVALTLAALAGLKLLF